MAHGYSSKFTSKAPSVSPRGVSVPGNSAKARMNQAAGQKVQSGGGAAIQSSKAKTAGPVAVASGTDMVMPADHPSAKTTRTTKGGTI